MAIIVAILMCYICIIILNIWSYLQSSAMSYLQNLFHIVNCLTFYMNEMLIFRELHVNSRRGFLEIIKNFPNTN